MVRIDNNGGISLDRGDCVSLPLFINIGTDEEPVRIDVSKFPELEVHLAITLPHQTFEQALIHKMFDTNTVNEYGDVVIQLSHIETMRLRPGKYQYEVKVRIPDVKNEFVRTIINRSPFLVIR